MIGHSGLNLEYHKRTLAKVVSGKVDVAPVVAAVGGFDAIHDALRAAYEASFPGKMVIYMDVDQPLTPVGQLTEGGPWSAEEERKFLARHAGDSK